MVSGLWNLSLWHLSEFLVLKTLSQWSHGSTMSSKCFASMWFFKWWDASSFPHTLHLKDTRNPLSVTIFVLFFIRDFTLSSRSSSSEKEFLGATLFSVSKLLVFVVFWQFSEVLVRLNKIIQLWLDLQNFPPHFRPILSIRVPEWSKEKSWDFPGKRRSGQNIGSQQLPTDHWTSSPSCRLVDGDVCYFPEVFGKRGLRPPGSPCELPLVGRLQKRESCRWSFYHILGSRRQSWHCLWNRSTGEQVFPASFQAKSLQTMIIMITLAIKSLSTSLPTTKLRIPLIRTWMN